MFYDIYTNVFVAESLVRRSMSHLRTSVRILLPIALITALGSGLFAQGLRKQGKPNLVFQYSSWGVVRFEIHDAIEGQDELTCSITEQGEPSKAVPLLESELRTLRPLLQSLKMESYALSLPAKGVVVICDGESVEIDIDAVSLRLLYRDDYEMAKSHKPIKLLVEWIKSKFPTASTPKQ